MKKEMRDAPVRKTERISFLKKIFLIIVLAVTGIFVFLHFYNIYNDKILYAERLNQMREVTTQLFLGLEDVVESQWKSAEQQINYLQENAPQNVEELVAYMEKQSILSDLESSQSNLIAIDSQGIFYTRTGRKGLLAEQRYLISKPERVSFVGNQLFDSHAEMAYLIQLPTPLTLEYGEKSVTITYYGILQNMEVLNKYFKCEAYDKQNGMYVVDEDGLKIFSENAADTLSGYNIFSVLERLEYQHGTSFEQTMEELNENGVAYSNAVINGEEYYYVLYRMNSENWNLVFTVPSRLVATNTVTLVNASTKIILIFSIVLLIVCSVLIIYILSRQQRLVLEQEKENNERLAATNEKLAVALKKAESAELKAKEASKAKSEFLANMSHDIRTPMNAIVGIVGLMEYEGDLSEKEHSYLQKIQMSSKHLLSLINDVLDMSKIESGDVELNRGCVSLAEQVRQVENIIRPQTEERGQIFTISVHEIRHEYVMADSVRLRQILINLLSNAVKYTQNGGKIEMDIVELPCEQEDHATISISVTDNGMGMSQEYLKHIFEPFTRSEGSVTNKVQGTGLGMAITKNIVDMAGGTIEVQSELGKGSRFEVTQTWLIEENIIQTVEAKGVLLIGQEEVLRRNVSASMEQTNVPFRAVSKSSEAFPLLESGKFDVVLLAGFLKDATLGKMVRNLRNATKNRLLVLCCDYAQREKVENWLTENDVDDLIPRPFFLSNLIDSINHAQEHKTVEENDSVLNGLRFLCAEDNELNAEILESILEINNASCVIYPNGQELVNAFESVKPGEFDVILMDMQMPVMNGLEATRVIRASVNPLGKTIPIVAMTANAFASDVQSCLNAGMDAHIAKPLDIVTLERTLKEIFGASASGGAFVRLEKTSKPSIMKEN